MPSLAAIITGLSPAWLIAGALGALAVVVIHAIGRRRAPRVLFPAASLIAAAEAGATDGPATSVRRWLLVALRALCVLLIAIAFDRPSLQSGGAVESGTGIVLVIDVSASMNAPAGGVTRADRARAIARDVIDAADPAVTPTAVLYAGERAHEAFPGFAHNRAALYTAIAGAHTLQEECDMACAVARAQELLGGAGEVHVITDGQHAVLPGVITHLVDTQNAPPNVAVTGLRWSPSRPVAGDEMRISCEVIAHAAESVHTRVVFMLGDSRAEVELTADPCVTTSASATIVCPSTESDSLEISAACTPDAFRDDDRVSASIEAREAVSVALLGAPSSVALALDPPGVRSRYRVLRAPTPSDVLLADVIVCDAGALGETAMLDAVEGAWGRGASILWIVSGSTDAQRFEEWAVSIGAPVRVALGEMSFEANGVVPDPSVLSEAAENGVFSDVKLGGVVGLDSAAPSWRHALRDSDGRPVLLVRGRASAVLFDPRQSALARSPALVVLLHELLAGMTAGDERDRPTEGFPRSECACIAPDLEARVAEVSSANSAFTTVRERPIGAHLALLVTVLLGVEGLVSALFRRGTP